MRPVEQIAQTVDDLSNEMATLKGIDESIQHSEDARDTMKYLLGA